MSYRPERPVGIYTDEDMVRWSPESSKNVQRSDFERDRARVLHSSALRRLGAKTQVVSPGSDDFVRTRLTHSLEVAQIGREIANALGPDPDVVDAACLSHDLGHPPFGHNGEQALNRAAHSIGGFEGNAQTLRLLSRLEPKVVTASGRSAGLNLTRASLDATCKYPWGSDRALVNLDTGTHKFGVYAEDREVFDWMRAGAPAHRRCLEAQIMDLADDVSYSVHDVEDAVVAGHLDLSPLDSAENRARLAEASGQWYAPGVDGDEILAAFDRLRAQPYWVSRCDGSRRAMAALKDMTSQLIGRFCEAVCAATQERYGTGPLTRYAADLVVPEETELEIVALKGVVVVFVLLVDDRQPFYARQRDVIASLVEVLRDRGPAELEPMFADDWRSAADDAGRLRAVVDQVASLTDVSALEWYKELC